MNAVAADAAPHGTGAIQTPAAYVDHLTSEMAKNAEAGKDTTDDRRTLEQYKALSPEDQEKYLGYLNDPKLWQSFFDSDEEISGGPGASAAPAARDASPRTTGDVVTKYNEDVSFVSGATVERETSKAKGVVQARDASWTDKATYTKKIKAFGITVTKLTVWVRYEATRSGARVLKALNSGSSKQNYNFAVLIDADNARPWVGGNRAHAETVWEGKITASFGSVQLDKVQHLSAAWDGTWKGTFKKG
ncbi:hypothetical protein AB0M25_29015 [Streptomyces griseomycini]|uniref:hypothetical protein n=1 Tax=Streptomyces griseomycini TaxID=66895 RepID=UPI00343F0137